MSIRGGFIEVAEELLKTGVEVNVRSHGGQTALKEATSHDCIEMVRLLKKAGEIR